MRFRPTKLQDVFLIDLDQVGDDRGWFMRTFAIDEFEAAGLQVTFPHHNLTSSNTAGTLRGLHYQVPPHSEVKVVHCLGGAIHDVLVDLRPDSSTYRQWESFVLDGPGTLLYVAEGFAHGYQTLTDNATIAYLMGAAYAPEHERGLRWDDPDLAIDWPMPPLLSPKDASHPDVDWESAWPAS